MTSLRCGTATRILPIFGLLILAATSLAQERPPILEKVAKTYGLDSWDKVDAIRYTWNIQFGTFNLSRSWEWEPKTTQVTYEGKDKDGKPVKVTYKRSELGSQPDSVKNDVDPGFINDNYTFLFPLKAYWDSSPTVIDAGAYNLQVGSGTAELVAVKYPAEAGGYTPGDTWELYVGKDGRVEYFVYHRGGAKKPNLLFATWGGQKKAGPCFSPRITVGSPTASPSGFLFGRGGQSDGFGHVDESAINKGGFIATGDAVRHGSNCLETITVVHELFRQIEICICRQSRPAG